MSMNKMKKELVMWNHESTTSPADAIINEDLLPDFDRSRCVLEISTKISQGSFSPVIAAKNAQSPGRRLVVSPVALSSEIRKKTPNLQLSLLSHLASAFLISPRSIVSVEAVPKEAHVADFMVLYFKDQYISRADMWKAACNLEGECIYVGKRITFTGGIRADVREIWRAGKKKLSAYVSANTKPVFRSESARYLIFIQMSKEMWEFEEDGELFYNKAIDGFLPELFKKWRTINAHHLVSIVLFTRVNYKGVSGPFCLPRTTGLSETELYQMRTQLERPFHNDFYKIVVDNVSSHHWESTLTELKRELHGFARDVLQQKRKEKAKGEETEEIPEGTISTAMHGNVLEAINLAAHQFNRDYIDRDLLRTGTSMLFVTAGTGVYEVDERLLKLTGESLLGNGIGMDFVCLSRRPLHMVPLFRYPQNKEEDESQLEFEYVLPYICEISYYGEVRDGVNTKFQPHLKMHDLQMTGRRATDTSNIRIDYLNEHIIFKGRELSQLSSGLDTRLDLYDELCFANKTNYLKITDTVQKDRMASETPGQEIIQLLGTSVPSSGEKTNFRSLYEHSKNTATIADGLDLPISRSKGFSNSSAVSSISLDSISHSLNSNHDLRSVSPVKTRSTFSRFMHRLSDKTDVNPIVSSSDAFPADAEITLKHDFARPVMLTLKAKPSLASITGAVTISSALDQKHETIFTAGFHPTDPADASSDSLRQSAQKPAAIPIRNKDQNVAKFDDTSGAKKMLDPIDLEEAKAQSYSQDHRFHAQRRRLSTSRSRNSLAVKYKPEKPDAPDASPWHVLANPSYPSKNASTMNVKAWRWAHVSDRARRTGDMNWESMCAPAALPLTTTTSIDLDELKSSKFSENSYSIYIGHDNQPLTQKQLLSEMIEQRLAQGYQIAQLPKKTLASQSSEAIFHRNLRRRPLHNGPLGDMGQTVYLTHAQMEVHCITCDTNRETIDVTFFVRKRQPPKPIGYSSLIWQLAQDDGYDDSVVIFKAMPTVHNWNYVDQMICGVERRFTEAVRFWRARFLLIPNDARDKRNPPPIVGGSEQFTEEEIKVAGIHKICELIEKSIYLTPHEIRAQKNSTQPKRATRVAVTFTTLEPAAYVAHENHHFSNKNDELNRSADNKIKVIKSTDISLYDLANELQAAKGIVIKDRLWHWRWHESSWVGSDLVTWLLDRTELTSREEACVFSQKLMDQGLFEHVQQKHGFLDGFYLYRLKTDYLAKTAKSWFGTRKVTPSLPSSRARTISNVSANSKSIDRNGVGSPTLRPQHRQSTVELSQWVEVDIDLHKKSHRPEFVSLHYDTVHNPETCFHIRLEWISVTAKLVEETIQHWARISEKYGLTLVEAPVDEAYAVTASNPFRAPLSIELCLDPPPAKPEESDIVTSAERELWLAKILKYWNFVLDQEAAHKFPSDVNVTYSWGRPSYRFTQFIHRSGMSLCQITPTGFLWLTNRLYVSRVAGAPTMVSLPSPIRMNSSIHASEPDMLRNSFREWCQDPEKLQNFFDQGLDSDSPHLVPTVEDRLGRPRKSSADDRSSIRSAAASQ